MSCRRIKVLLFGPARDALNGSPEIEVMLTEDLLFVGNIRAELMQRFPALRRVLETSIFAMNNRMIRKSEEVSTKLPLENPEIVLVPPVSGG
jgi:molybdopterin converting factor small subunit